MDIIFSHTEHYRQYSILYTIPVYWKWSGCFRNNETAPQYSKTNRDNPSCSYHLSFQQIFDSFFIFISSFILFCRNKQSILFIKFYINSFLPNPADYMISVLDIPKGNFSFFSNKVLTDTDVAVYFKPGSSHQFKTKDLLFSLLERGLTSPSDLSIVYFLYRPVTFPNRLRQTRKFPVFLF